LIHPYSDSEACQATIRCHKLEEILAAKLNTLIQRRKVSDLFDLIFSIIINTELDVDRGEVIRTFLAKTIYEPDPPTAKELLLNVPIEEYRPFWKQIIAPIFSLFDFDRAVLGYRELIDSLFAMLPAPAPTPAFAPTVGRIGPSGRLGSNLAGMYFTPQARNTIISAGRSRQLVEIVYDGVSRLVEPYAFEYRMRKKDGRGMEYFWGWDTTGGRSGKVGIKMFIYEKIQAVYPTNISFTPRYMIEF
jgi:hypothetical protein